MSIRNPFAVVALTVALASPAAAATVGQPAPDFSLPDSNGVTQTLAAQKGKFVVLEWVNYDCPFVRKHYGSGNMQKLQTKWTAKDVVWFSINSSASGKQGQFEPARINELLKEKKATPTAYLIDSDGTTGRAYAAKTTPHMFVIDPAGKIVYAGGIDDKPSTDLADIATARNHLDAALNEATAGKPVTVATSQPYGCSVKY